MWAQKLRPTLTEHSGQTESQAETIRRMLQQQQDSIQNHEAALQELGNCQAETNRQLAELTSFLRSRFPQTSAASSTLDPAPENLSAPESVSEAPVQSTFSDCHLPSPPRFDGDPQRFRGFLMQCNIQFNHSPHRFALDSTKISYIIAHLSDRALDWAEVRFSSSTDFNCTYEEFLSEFKLAFNQDIDKGLSSQDLLKTRQEQRSVADFSIDFRIQAAASGWNSSALKSVYINALSDQIKDELATLDESKTLEDLIRLSIRLHNRIRARAKERGSRNPPVRTFSP
uniref:Ty3 transposon capsid-like protein domain-containing protein n=1 Tax=Poecilia formosa TaxID=48698 RepID=A0A096MAR9_POEFO